MKHIHSDWHVSLFVVATVVLCFTGCERRHLAAGEPQEITLRDMRFTLKPPADARPVDLAGVELFACSEGDRAAIAHWLGRIPTNLPIQRIEIAWAERPLAARITVAPDLFIFLKHDHDDWKFAGSVMLNVHTVRQSDNADRSGAETVGRNPISRRER